MGATVRWRYITMCTMMCGVADCLLWMKPLNQISSPWSWGTLHQQQSRNSGRPVQEGRSCAQCFGTEKAFCLWTSCLKAPQPMQMSIATHWKNCVTQSRISDMACLAMVLWWFMTAPSHTHCNTKSHHDIWLGTIWSSPYSPHLVPSEFHLFLHLNSFLAGWRFDENEVK